MNARRPIVDRASRIAAKINTTLYDKLNFS
jgi:hypothetical protein